MTTRAHDSKVWFITGASTGIGRALTLQALDAGERVTAIARDSATLKSLGDHEQLLTISADVGDENALHDAVKQTETRFGRIDVVANNAGYGLHGAVEEATDSDARAIFDTNVFGVLNVLRATLPVLRRQRHGHILQGSSMVGQSSYPGLGILSATKHAVEGLSRTLAEEVTPLGIRVTLIEPGPVATEFVANVAQSGGHHTDYDQTVRATRAPFDPVSTPERIATAIRTVAATETPPLHLALGRIGGAAIRAALDARMTDLDAWQEITTHVDA